jgi:hypothetical protein
MKLACFLIFTLFIFSSIAQQAVKRFEADEFGRVKDPDFLKLIKERNYQLVEDFQPTFLQQLMLAAVWKNGTKMCIDLNAIEFESPHKAIDFYKSTFQVESIKNESKTEEMKEIHTWIEEDLTKKNPLWMHFDNAEKLENDFFKVRLKGLYGIYSSKGVQVIPIIFKYIQYFSELNCFLCWRPEDNRFYIYDNQGKLTTDCGFYSCSPFNKHLFKIQDKENGKYGIWNQQTSDTLLPVIYEEIQLPNLHKLLCQIVLKENDSLNYGIIDLNGNIIIEPKYQWIQYAPKSNYFILKLDNKYGAVTPKYEQLLPFEYEKLASAEIAAFDEFSFLWEHRLLENMLIFKTPETKTGVMNLDKKVVIEPIYDELLATYNGVLAFQGDLTGLLSIDGEIIVPFQKMTVNNVKHGKIYGLINDKMCIIDFYGNVVYQ